MKLVAEKADETLYEGKGGRYYQWSTSISPLLKESKLGAGKLLLHPLGFALPHFADSSKIGYVLEGMCTVGFVAPNSSEETVVVIKKGDAIPVAKGVVSWWFNGGETDLTIIYIGETTKAEVAGQFTYFFVAGVLGLLNEFQSDIVAKLFDLNEKEAEEIVTGQPAVMIVKLKKGVDFPHPSGGVKEKLFSAIDTPKADTVVKGGGIINSLTEKKFPMLVETGLSARFVRLNGKAMLAPSYEADGSGQVIYAVKGSGRIRVVGSDGTPSFDGEVGEGELMVIPEFYAVTVIADEDGMELFSVINSSKPVFMQLAGNVSVWKALSPVVLQSALNITPQSEQLFKSKNEESLMIIPPRN